MIKNDTSSVENIGVRTVQLVGGIQMVAHVQRLPETKSYIFENPMRIFQSEQGLGIGPMLHDKVHEGEAVEISEQHVLFMTKTPKELADKFVELRSGIIIPTPNIVKK